jgi:lipopolysaccharide/colanic/teichoic acid biosynthesis glycosyltransferase
MVKRCLDVVGSALLIVLLSPVAIVVALLVAGFLGRPVLFAQKRPGLHGNPFLLRKFRTMHPPSPGTQGSGTDEHRLTAFGRALRASSLDELPELWNVLRGDMSLVGPRPLLMEYLPLYTPEQARRHEVKPGLTGLAQVRGRNGLTWDEKFALDVEYVDTRSTWLDLRILLRTPFEVLRRRGISSEGHATAPNFTAGHGPLERTR